MNTSTKLRILHTCPQCVFVRDAKIVNAIYEALTGGRACSANPTAASSCKCSWVRCISMSIDDIGICCYMWSR